MADEHKPGEKVPSSGIYLVRHDSAHTSPHEVTCVFDETFPPCNHCGHHPRFTLVRAAIHLASHKQFR